MQRIKKILMWEVLPATSLKLVLRPKPWKSDEK